MKNKSGFVFMVFVPHLYFFFFTIVMGKSPRQRTQKYQSGVAPTGKKGGLGQHFIKNTSVVHNIIEKSGIKPTDIVLEIGPGAGILTMELLKKAKKVIAIEKDERMVAEIKKKVQGTYGSEDG